LSSSRIIFLPPFAPRPLRRFRYYEGSDFLPPHLLGRISPIHSLELLTVLSSNTK